MPKIVITEQDLTSPGGTADNYEVVYVPGLVDPAFDGDDVLPYNEPTQFTSVRDFMRRCGSRPVFFETDQRYVDLGATTPAVAVPYDGVMFKAGDAAPGYVMACELLNAGLTVLYERLNPEVSIENVKVNVSGSGEVSVEGPGVVKLTTEPSDWAAKYQSYYTVVRDVYVQNTFENMEFATGNYFSKTVEDGEDVYTPLTTQPTDWNDNWTSYYHLQNILEYVSSVTKDQYDKIESADAPTDWTTATNKYYSKTGDTYVPVPADTQYAKDTYYERVEVTSAPNFSGNTYYSIDASNTLTIKAIYNELSKAYGSFVDDSDSEDGTTEKFVSALTDKGAHSFKYVTSGGYPNFEVFNGSVATAMTNLAKTRGDCIALIDHTYNVNRPIEGTNSVWDAAKSSNSSSIHSTYSTMFTPWFEYSLVSGVNIGENKSTMKFPGSYAYLLGLADSLRSNASWLAIAGAARGSLQNVANGGVKTLIPNGLADDMQPRDGVAVNAITEIKPYGLTIWGNRTLHDNSTKQDLTASSFLNIRNMICDVKKRCYSTARMLTFEQNNDVLWVNFKNNISLLLDSMVSGYGLTGYKIVRDNSREESFEKATVCAKVYLYPAYPVEDFYIDIVLSDDEESVE